MKIFEYIWSRRAKGRATFVGRFGFEGWMKVESWGLYKFFGRTRDERWKAENERVINMVLE